MESATKETWFDRFKRVLFNNRTIAIVLLGFIVLVGIGNLTGALNCSCPYQKFRPPFNTYT